MSRENGRVSISTLDEPEVELDPMSRDVRAGALQISWATVRDPFGEGASRMVGNSVAIVVLQSNG